MKKEISKKLLSEVFNKKVFAIYTENEEGDDFIRENEISYTYRIDMQGMGFEEIEKAINIYELAHKCKEWALSKGYILMSKPRTSSSFAICVFCKNGKCDYEDDLWNDFRADTEVEAIFKACQWIMNKLQESK